MSFLSYFHTWLYPSQLWVSAETRNLQRLTLLHACNTEQTEQLNSEAFSVENLTSAVSQHSCGQTRVKATLSLVQTDRSRWPCGILHMSASAWLVRLRVRIPLLFFCWRALLCVFSVGINRSKEYGRLWFCVIRKPQKRCDPSLSQAVCTTEKKRNAVYSQPSKLCWQRKGCDRLIPLQSVFEICGIRFVYHVL